MLDPEKFFEFEIKNHLFDIRDKNGVNVWDIIRFCVYMNILEQDAKNINNIKKGTNQYLHKSHHTLHDVLTLIYSTFRLISACLKNNEYFTFLNSRDFDGNTFIDRNQKNILDVIGQSHFIAQESSQEGINRTSYRFKCYYQKLPLPVILCRKYYDFSFILNLLRESFPSILFDEAPLLHEYRRFYIERRYYKIIFKRFHLRGVFFTQNEIQKGLKAACEELSIPSYELQHGTVESSNMAYSYPNINLKGKAYMPSIIFSLSKHWFHSFHSPDQIDIVPVGNDYFYCKQENNQNSKNLLVISNDYDGLLLAPFILNCLNDNFWSDYHIFFKLHPNQYQEFNYYKDFFKKEDNIEVISNQRSVTALLKECATVFLIQSTVTYEALQKGTKVCLLKRESLYSYKIQQDVFDNPNVYFIDSEEDLKIAILRPKVYTDIKYFTSFDIKLFKETLKT